MLLHNIRKNATGNATWGCMWEKGTFNKCEDIDAVLVCKGKNKQQVEMQSRVTAYWPDGSIKWTSHTADTEYLGDEIEVVLERNSAHHSFDKIDESNSVWNICGKEMQVTITKNSSRLFDSVIIGGREVMRNAVPVLSLEEPIVIDGCEAKKIKKYEGRVRETQVEEQGNIQTIIKFVGDHVLTGGDGSESKIPFIIRMVLGTASREIRFIHTFLYDGDENKDFLSGLGIRFESPVSGPMYNRHIKFTVDNGVFHEECTPLISWRPRVPAGLYEAQVEGMMLGCGDGDGVYKISEEQRDTCDKIMENAPHFGEYSLCQDSPSHFLIHKKLTGDEFCYIDSLHGNRSIGGCAFGSESGTIMVGVRDFWEKYPSGITVKNLDKDIAETTIWFYSPEASSYDFRHYAARGYNQVCYEGYDYKGADPDGIACTNECAIIYEDGVTPRDERLLNFAANINTPPLYVASPEFYHDMRAFGFWSLKSEETEVERWIELQLERAFEFYKNEVEQRGWYGIFNYGDFMHTYDSNRHQWRYDIGGYAWDNTELVPTLWLWNYFLRTGREDVFTLAEKLSRHASEVDVYHFGKYKGLGSRHNVRHWGCPCKEARIAMAAHHRVLYYLTGDHRLEDIFDELKDNEFSFLNKDPLGDFFEKSEMVYKSHARSGPDWSSLVSNWMTEWERNGDERYLEKIKVGLSDISAAPLRLCSGPDFEFDPETVHLRYIGERTTGGTHLQVCMGAGSVWMETAELMEDENFKDMIAELGRFALLPREQQLKECNGLIKDREYTFPFMFTSIAAYGAKHLSDKWLAKKTWQTLLETLMSENNKCGFESVTTKNAGNMEELVEIPWVTTNFVSQWCLNTIMALDFIREELPKNWEEADELLADANDGAFRRA